MSKKSDRNEKERRPKRGLGIYDSQNVHVTNHTSIGADEAIGVERSENVDIAGGLSIAAAKEKEQDSHDRAHRRRWHKDHPIQASIVVTVIGGLILAAVLGAIALI